MNLFDYNQIYPRFNFYLREDSAIFHGNVPKIWERFHNAIILQKNKWLSNKTYFVNTKSCIHISSTPIAFI